MAIATKARPASAPAVDKAAEKRIAGNNELRMYRDEASKALDSFQAGGMRLSVYLLLAVLKLVTLRHPVINLDWLKWSLIADKRDKETRNADVMQHVFGITVASKRKTADQTAKWKLVNMAYDRLRPTLETAIRCGFIDDFAATDDGKYLVVPGKVFGTNVPRVVLDGQKVRLKAKGKAEPEFKMHRDTYKRGVKQLVPVVLANLTDLVIYNSIKGAPVTKPTGTANAGQGKATGAGAKALAASTGVSAAPNRPRDNAVALRQYITKVREEHKEIPPATMLDIEGFIGALFVTLGEKRFYAMARDAAELYNKGSKVRAQARRARKAKVTETAAAATDAAVTAGQDNAPAPAPEVIAPAGK